MNHGCELSQDLDPELQVSKVVHLTKLESAFRQKLKLAEFMVGKQCCFSEFKNKHGRSYMQRYQYLTKVMVSHEQLEVMLGMMKTSFSSKIFGYPDWID